MTAVTQYRVARLQDWEEVLDVPTWDPAPGLPLDTDLDVAHARLHLEVEKQAAREREVGYEGPRESFRLETRTFKASEWLPT